jgi:hypothetical protein
VRRRSPLLAAAAVAVLLAGCGNDRQRPAGFPRAALPAGHRLASFPPAGISFERPRNWVAQPGRAPLVATVRSGRAVVAVWRYPRQERLPLTTEELQRARRALLAAARRRDPSLRVLSALTLRIADVPGVELVAQERIGGEPRRVRSTHLYAHGAEFVVDAFAPPGEFDRLDRAVFRPLRASVRVRQAERRPGP